MTESFLHTDFRVLTPEAFDFVLNNELKRAVRSQNFLTLVLLQTAADPQDASAVAEVARLVSREVRETDLLSAPAEGRLQVVLLDADLPNSQRVIERVMSRLEHYQFSIPMDIQVGAACCPTHGADADTLRQVAARHVAAIRGDARGPASHAQ